MIERDPLQAISLIDCQLLFMKRQQCVVSGVKCVCYRVELQLNT